MISAIENINKTFAANLKLDVRCYGMAESIAIRDNDSDITFPAIVLPSGECISVFDETDKHDVTLYHRLNDISYQENNTSYGNSRSYSEIADLSVVVFGKRKKIDPFSAERAICDAIARGNSNTLTRSDFNSLQIFATEYAGVTYFMSPDFFLFKTNYRITSTFPKKCCK